MEENNKIEIKKANNLPLWVTPVMLFILGVVFIISGSVYWNKVNNDKQYYLETSAVITAINSNYDNDNGTATKSNVVYVRYSVDGVLYENVKLPYYIATMKERQTITITYDSRNPGQVVNSAQSSYILSLVFIVVGAAVVVFDVFGTKKSIKKEKQEVERINLLLSTGIVKRCTITFISEGKDNDYFECLVDGYEYHSQLIKHTPKLFTGCTVNIYFEKEGYEERISKERRHSNYYIDLNSVEEGPYQEPKKLI